MRLTRTAVALPALALAAYLAFNATVPATGAASGRSGAAEGAQQQDQQPQQSQQPLKVQVTVVNVFATVRDKSHAIVADLKQEDFKILEDGQEQKVAFFSKEVNLPITLGMLIDTSGSMGRIIGAEQDAASRFIKEVMRPKDLAMVISFDFDANLLADFTEDTAVLERAIRRTTINAVAAGGVFTPGTIPNANVGGTHLYDAVYVACHDQLASEAGRKAIILLTDAEDEGSKLAVQDAIEAAQRSDAVIHVLLLADRAAFMSNGMWYSGASVAKKMADETGGRVIEVHNENTLEKAFDQISQELRSQYVLGYYPTNAKRDGAFHKIIVQVDRPDVKILARKGYYAPR
jgi:VWFA-related protein